MSAPTVFWPTLLGICFLVAGIFTYRRDFKVATARKAFGLAAVGPPFVAASLAAFGGEHFTAAPTLAALVPKWLPAPLFIAYFVGVAHVAAASSFVARRYVRWSAMLLAIMFGLFVLLMDLPAAIAHPATRMNWSLAVREATFAMGALALFATETGTSAKVAPIMRIWTAGVLVFYGVENLLYPQFSAGVPNARLTPSWVPMPMVIAYVTGALLVVFGVAALLERYASSAIAQSGLLMLLLTLVLYVPEYFLAHTVSERVTAINFVFDTLLFSGTMWVISRVIDAGFADAEGRFEPPSAPFRTLSPTTPNGAVRVPRD